jgi:hypothetical protein
MNKKQPIEVVNCRLFWNLIVWVRNVWRMSKRQEVGKREWRPRRPVKEMTMK